MHQNPLYKSIKPEKDFFYSFDLNNAKELSHFYFVRNCILEKRLKAFMMITALRIKDSIKMVNEHLVTLEVEATLQD